MSEKLRLGVNIDHVATLRNARGGTHPCPIRAALIAMEAGADGITAHLREDRRHIKDADIERLKKEVPLPLNFEMAATDEMVEIACALKPNAACIVPEKREELTTEGGLDVVRYHESLTPQINKLRTAGCRVSLFVDPDTKQIDYAKAAGTDIVELHTGEYAHTDSKDELSRIQQAASYAKQQGLEVHAGHGLTFSNVKPIAAIEAIVELNIGHFLVGESLFLGLEGSIKQMRHKMNIARSET